LYKPYRFSKPVRSKNLHEEFPLKFLEHFSY
jgi:hypothetical protein